jgi:hypothetical protein
MTASSPNYAGMALNAGKTVGDLYTGAAKEITSTLNNLGHAFVPDWALNAANKHLGTHINVPTAQQQESYFAPKNTAETIGKGATQVGEFMLPGSAEEAGATKLASLLPRLGKMSKPLARIATSALSSGAVNTAQGGSPVTGAAMGAGGQIVGQLLKAMAPAIAEGALNIRKLDRAYGKSGGAIGRSVLDETHGIRPATIAQSAEDRLGELIPQLNAAADRASVQPNPANGVLLRPAEVGSGPIPTMLPNPSASLGSARGALMDALGTATRQGERTTAGQLQPMATHLSETMAGQPISENVTPRQLLDLKRGFGNEFIHRWNPETMTGVKGTAARTYHAMGDEFNRTVPEAEELNGRISSLIPVAKRAASEELNAPTMQRAANRFAAHTGALTGAGVGGAVGYREGGVPGAIAGGLTGVVAPELISSPEGQMAVARTLNMASGLKPLVGTAAQLTRKKDSK